MGNYSFALREYLVNFLQCTNNKGWVEICRKLFTKAQVAAVPKVASYKILLVQTQNCKLSKHDYIC